MPRALAATVAAFRNWITADGAPGPTGGAGSRPKLAATTVCRACLPLAHRTTIFREIKGLQSMIGLSVTHWLMADSGWTFEPGPGVVADPLHSAEFIWSSTNAATPTTPAHHGSRSLDKGTSQIVSNESAQIIRMFNSAFDHLGASAGTTTRSICARGSTVSTPEYTTPSTTACTRPGSPARRLSTMRQSAASSRRSSGWKDSSPGNVFSAGTY